MLSKLLNDTHNGSSIIGVIEIVEKQKKKYETLSSIRSHFQNAFHKFNLKSRNTIYHPTLKLCNVKTRARVCVCVCVCGPSVGKVRQNSKTNQTSGVSKMQGAIRLILCTNRLQSQNWLKEN